MKGVLKLGLQGNIGMTKIIIFHLLIFREREEGREKH